MTTFIMPTAPTTAMPPGQSPYTASPTHYQHQQYFSNQAFPISPSTSATTSPNGTLNASPTSPRASLNQPQSNLSLPLHAQQQRNLQLRPPKSPLYVPAVLRPTEPPKSKRILKPSPLTPPHSTSSSFDDLQGVKPLSRRSTMDSGKFGLGRVIEGKNEPTRSHWLPDSASPICSFATCARPFSFYNRRHHCRRCGKIFCGTHSSSSILLDAAANFDVDGAMVRACEGCWDEFRVWDLSQRSRSNSESGSDLVPPSPAVAVTQNNGALKGLLGRGQEMGQSVPRDWSWSTF